MSSERFLNFNVAQMSSEPYQTKNPASSKIYVFLPRIYSGLDVLRALLINISFDFFPINGFIKNVKMCKIMNAWKYIPLPVVDTTVI